MAVKFLTSEWCKALTDTINAHDGFRSAIAGVDLALLFEVTDTPESGEYRYHMKIADGTATIAEGDLDGADATIKNNYETAVGISKGEINTQMAFMTGKLQVQGDLAKLMMNQAPLNQFAAAAANLDVEYPA